MSFESLVKKLMKEGKSKTAATKIAGSVANAKMKGAGSGPTAKQKARAKSPATKKPKPRAVIRDKDRVADKSRSYTDKKGKKIEIKTFKHQKAYDSGVKPTEEEYNQGSRQKSSRLSNTVELHKTKTKKDGTTKTKIKRAAGGTKKSQRLHTKFAKGKNKEGSSDVTVNRKSKSPTTMKKQKAPTKMKSPAKKPLVGGQKKLPKELQEAILKAPAKMLTKSGIKMMDKSPAKRMKINPIEEGSTSRKERVKLGRRKTKIVETNKSKSPDGPNVKTKTKTVYNKKTGKGTTAQKTKVDGRLVNKSKTNSPMYMKTPMKKSKQKVEQDYARNAIADYKSGKTKEAKYEKKKALEVAAGESMAKMKKSPSMMKGGEKRKVKRMSVKLGSSARPGERTGNTEFKPMKKLPLLQPIEKKDYNFQKMKMKEASPTKMKSNQDGGAYAAKNPAAPARQLKKLGSVLSKHFKSNR